ncbi:MAG: FAD:protein FMN transferase [Bacteroidales bacterium]|nr:FAD:protein FMN transferase [Bacteroidales bacterium]
MKLITSFFFVLTIILSSCNNISTIEPTKTPEKYVIQGAAQGTYYAITYYDPHGRKLDHSIDSLLKAFDMSASNYQDSSIISKVNANIPVKLDEIFLGNFNLAKEVSLMTDGAFDITVRPLVELWGFGKKQIGEVSLGEVDSVMSFIGFQKVRIEDGKVIKDDPRLQLDFNAIAQGYSVDVTAKYLRSLGIENFLVDIGGEVVASGQKADSSFWKVGVERPKENEAYGEALSAVISLKDRALATSGNYRKFYEKDGVKYSHTIDPKTGYPARSVLLSATVIAENAALADALATALMVKGIDSSKVFLEKHPEFDGFLIYSDEAGNYKFYETEGIKEIITKN